MKTIIFVVDKQVSLKKKERKEKRWGLLYLGFINDNVVQTYCSIFGAVVKILLIKQLKFLV